MTPSADSASRARPHTGSSPSPPRLPPELRRSTTPPTRPSSRRWPSSSPPRETPCAGTTSSRAPGSCCRSTSKDLWLASYFAYGLYATEGLAGAITGATLLAEMTENYWQGLFPEASRLRSRDSRCPGSWSA